MLQQPCPQFLLSFPSIKDFFFLYKEFSCQYGFLTIESKVLKRNPNVVFIHRSIIMYSFMLLLIFHYTLWSGRASRCYKSTNAIYKMHSYIVYIHIFIHSMSEHHKDSVLEINKISQVMNYIFVVNDGLSFLAIQYNFVLY